MSNQNRLGSVYHRNLNGELALALASENEQTVIALPESEAIAVLSIVPVAED